jgi:nicotinate-nucleotide adenylyltransferase
MMNPHSKTPSTDSPSIAIYGAAFNPPHLGHVDAIQQLLREYACIHLVPSASHAFNKVLLPLDQRCEMLKILLDDAHLESTGVSHACLPSLHLDRLDPSDKPKILIDSIESHLLSLAPEKPVYTWDLLHYYQTFYGCAKNLVFVIGPDNARPENWHRFYRFQEIEQTFSIKVIDENIPVHSSDIRQTCASVDDLATRENRLKQMTGSALAKYLVRHALYRTPSRSAENT